MTTAGRVIYVLIYLMIWVGTCEQLRKVSEKRRRVSLEPVWCVVVVE